MQRKQLPPGGVAEQYGVGSLAFTGGCLDITPAGTATRSITTGDRIRLCVEGLGAGTPTVEIVLPDGTTRAPDGNPGSFTWHARLRDPFGLYRITATVGSSTATASFRVDRPSGPTTLDGEPAIGPAGTTFSMGLAGFPANGRVQPDLYRYLRDEGAKAVYEFFTPLEPVVVDGRGEGLVTVATQAGDSPGRYCIKPRGIEPDRPVRPGGTGGCAGFEVRRA